MRRLLSLALLAMLAGAAAASPASALHACTPDAPAGACVHVVCLKLCVFQAEVDPWCDLGQPAPRPVESACARLDAQYVVIGGG